ncbi:hypothetical protein ACFE04_022318 [Oxalis oulophora]
MICNDAIFLEDYGTANDDVQILDSLESGTSSKGKKRKFRTTKDDDNISMFTKSIEKIVDVFEKCTTKLVKCHQKYPIPEDAIWKQLEDLGIAEDKLPMVYYHFVQNPDALRALLGCPFERRKSMLKHLVPGYSSSD